MWYEVLPSIGIIMGMMALGFKATSWTPQLLLDRPCFRKLFVNDEHHHWMRDRRLTGDSYKFQGLEAIPDADETSKSK